MPRTVSLSSPPASLISRVREITGWLHGCTPLCQCTPLSPDITFIFMPGSDVGLSPLTRLRPCPINCISRQQTLQSLSSSPFPRCPLLLCDPFRVTSPFRHAVVCHPVRTEPTRHIMMSHTRITNPFRRQSVGIEKQCNLCKFQNRHRRIHLAT